MNEFWIHLHATRELVSRLRDQVQPGSSGEHLINISCFLQIMSDSTDIGLEPTPWSADAGGGSGFLSGGHTLEFTYGITARLADYLRRTCLLARNRTYYNSNGTNPPVGFLLECGEVFKDVSEWHISLEPLESFSTSGDVTNLLASEHIHAFAAGIRIYYHTRVAPCDQDLMQSLIRRVASHLMRIEEIKNRTGYNATPTAAISWPGFMASCQAKESERGIWVKWWKQMLGYRIGNLYDLWTVVQEAWSLTDAEVGDGPAWEAVLKRTGRRILAI